jgi:5,10-methylenetetrahydrofolate reductase
MKNYHVLFISLCLLLASCGIIQPTYFGDKLPPTTSVDIFYSAHDVKQQYKVIGHLTIPNIGQEKVKAKLMEYAKTIGADAIVITGNTVDTGGKYGSDVVNADALKYDK